MRARLGGVREGVRRRRSIPTGIVALLLVLMVNPVESGNVRRATPSTENLDPPFPVTEPKGSEYSWVPRIVSLPPSNPLPGHVLRFAFEVGPSHSEYMAQLQISSDPSFGQPIISTISLMAYEVPEDALRSGRSYYLRVRGIRVNREPAMISSWSPPIRFLVPKRAALHGSLRPPTPTILSPTPGQNIESGWVRIEWRIPDADASRFRIQMSDDSGFRFPYLDWFVSAGSTMTYLRVIPGSSSDLMALDILCPVWNHEYFCRIQELTHGVAGDWSGVTRFFVSTPRGKL